LCWSYGAPALPRPKGRVIILTILEKGAVPMSNHALTNIAPTGIYLLRGVPRELQRAARARALADGTSLRSVLLRALREYADRTWTPQLDETQPAGTDGAVGVVALPARPRRNNGDGTV
jgi:hypothetical protein